MNDDEIHEVFEYCCSECDAKVEANDEFCPKCGANLEEIITENPDDIIVPIKTYISEIDAQVAISHLQSNKIDAVISKDDCGSMEPYIQPSTGVRVLVKENDAEKALKVLDAMQA